MSTKKDFLSVLIKLLGNESLYLRQIARVGDVIAAGARFNAWVAVEGKRTLDSDAIIDVIGAYEDAVEHCYAAIERFETFGDHRALEVARGETLRGLQRHFLDM